LKRDEIHSGVSNEKLGAAKLCDSIIENLLAFVTDQVSKNVRKRGNSSPQVFVNQLHNPKKELRKKHESNALHI
jgi:hypothetical protein